MMLPYPALRKQGEVMLRSVEIEAQRIVAQNQHLRAFSMHF